MTDMGMLPKCVTPFSSGSKPTAVLLHKPQVLSCSTSSRSSWESRSASPISIVSERHMVSVDQPLGRGKNHQRTSSIERRWRSLAGGLLLLAAAMETGLLPALETAFSSCLPHLSAWSRRRLLLTLLF